MIFRWSRYFPETLIIFTYGHVPDRFRLRISGSLWETSGKSPPPPSSFPAMMSLHPATHRQSSKSFTLRLRGFPSTFSIIRRTSPRVISARVSARFDPCRDQNRSTSQSRGRTLVITVVVDAFALYVLCITRQGFAFALAWASISNRHVFREFNSSMPLDVAISFEQELPQWSAAATSRVSRAPLSNIRGELCAFFFSQQ